MQAVIVAAGMGSRLGAATREVPKCLLDVAGRSVLEHQIAAFARNDIHDVTVVTGYLADRVQIAGPRFLFNSDYATTNVLHSLMIGASEMTAPFIAVYSDVLFRPEVVAELCRCADDIAIVVDVDWRSAYAGRDRHPLSEAEKVAFDHDGAAIRIGKARPSPDDACGEFIGMLKCTERGGALLRAHHARAGAQCQGGRFMAAPRFERAYVTDLLQYLIDASVTVRCVPIRRGWMEIDTTQDLERARASWNKEEVSV